MKALRCYFGGSFTNYVIKLRVEWEMRQLTVFVVLNMGFVQGREIEPKTYYSRDCEAARASAR